MSRLVALAAAVAAVAAGSAPAKPAHQLFAVVGARGAADIAALDPHTLRPLDAPRARLGSVGPWSFSPDRNHLAVATGFVDSRERPRPVRLRVVDLWTMRKVADVRLGSDPRLTTGWIDPVVLVAWLDAERVLVLRRLADASLQLVTVDTRRQKVVRRQRFAGHVLARAQTARELVLLVGQPERISAPQLVVVDGRGNQRRVSLNRMRAGWSGDMAADPPVSRVLTPGLAVDTGGRAAYVVEPSGLVAEVPLDRLEPSYRAARGSYAKLSSGASRHAVALDGGLLAIAGDDSTIATDADGRPYQTSTPSGLELLHTRTWTTRIVDRDASRVVAWRGALLVTAVNYDSRRSERSGRGVVLYERNGDLRFRVLDGRAVVIAGVFGERAYVYLLGTGRLAIVDLVRGRVLEERTGNIPWLLLDPQA